MSEVQRFFSPRDLPLPPKETVVYQSLCRLWELREADYVEYHTGASGLCCEVSTGRLMVARLLRDVRTLG